MKRLALLLPLLALAEPRPGEAGSLLEGAAERSEAGGVSHAKSAEGAE